MDRRTCLGSLTGGLFALPLAVEGQTPAPRVGYLSLAPGPSARSEALQQGFRDLGYIDGQSLVVVYRWTDGRLDRAQEAAAELVRLGVNVIVTGGPQATLAAKKATSTTPIVMAFDYDPSDPGSLLVSRGPAGTSPGPASHRVICDEPTDAPGGGDD